MSIIIPNQDHIANLNMCIDTIVAKTSYSNYEIIIIENNSKDESTKAGYQALVAKYNNVRLVQYEGAFNAALINNFGAKEANCDYLLFLNSNTKVINDDWLTELLQEAMPQDVGVVGAKLYYADDTIEHVGIVVGLGGATGLPFCGMPKNDVGYARRAITTQEVSGVSAACMLVKRTVFEKINGFDEQFAVAYNDVDLCLRTSVAGYRVIFTPYAQLYHYESENHGKEVGVGTKRFIRERKLFCKRWKDLIKNGDPYYNQNLSRVNPVGKLRV